MKFKYVGQAGFKDLDLCIAGICKKDDVLIPDTIIEIPDDNQDLITFEQDEMGCPVLQLRIIKGRN